ncbi:MAG: hypothetical protein H8D56_01455 [Planctomycetes bacterium]|nr:hypothetical protein [Planctomycetota bacterium]MBL7143431.1 hypothetical protein [Phycisphaerae bacterium]
MKKRTVKILKVIAIVLVVLGVIYAIAVSVSSAKLRRAYTELKKDGRPMESADVIPPKVPDTENAALLYESAALLLKAQPAVGENLLEDLGDLSDKFIKESLDSDKLTEFKQLIGLDVVTQALSIVEQGTRRDSCRFDLDYDDGLNMLLLNLSGMRNFTRILCAKAYLEAKNGNPDTAWDMLTTQLKFADALRTEPVLVSKIVRMAMIRLSCETITKLCEIAPPNAQQSSDIQNLLKDLDDIRPLIHSIDAERLLIGEWVFNLTKDEMYKANLQVNDRGDTGLLPKLIIFGITFKPLFLADHAAYLRFMHDGTRFLERPYSPEQGEILENGVQKKRYIVTRILTPAIFRVKEIHCQMTAQLRIIQAGLALLKHKQTEGTFPATLEALKLQNINDPFFDGPLSYKTEGQDFVLYSVGPDQKDNNGSPRQKKQKEDWDIVWNFSNKP